MPTLQVEALDTLFFRDGRPFSMGTETWATGLFPPNPSTWYGMLRSLYFADNLGDLQQANSEYDPTLNLDILGILPQLNGVPAFPTPMDLFSISENDSKATVFQCRPFHSNNILSAYDFSYVLNSGVEGKIKLRGGNSFLPDHGMKKYLVGDETEFLVEPTSSYLTKEPKVGIGKDYDLRTASEGRLYRVEMQRLKGKSGGILRFLLQYENLLIRPEGLSRFGAEGKGIYFRSSEFPEMPQVVDRSHDCYRIYFASPAIFEQGPIPLDWLQENDLELLCAAQGKPLRIGGFDMKLRKPKPMMLANPPGSVWMVRAVSEKGFNTLKQIDQKNIYKLADAGDKFAQLHQKQGYGLTYVGKLNLKNV